LLKELCIKTPKLEILYLGGNFFSDLEDFRSLVKNYLPYLKKLDDEYL